MGRQETTISASPQLPGDFHKEDFCQSLTFNEDQGCSSKAEQAARVPKSQLPLYLAREPIIGQKWV